MEDKNQFKMNRVKTWKTFYSDEQSTRRRNDQTATYRVGAYGTALDVRKALADGIANPDTLVQTSKQLYATNPIYAAVVDYLSNMYLWRYKVTPHRVYTKSKAKAKKQMKADEYNLTYNLMLEVVDGLSIETKFPALLSLLFTTGSVYFTTICDEDSITIDTLLLEPKYCRKIGETQYGTAIIQFDFSYFDNLGFNDKDLKDYLKSFPKEFTSCYNKYKKDNSLRWQVLDPRFSSGVMLNDVGLPRYLYLYGGILDYEKYQDNELKRNDNLLKYIVVHKMPHYEDQLIFEIEEVEAIHKSLKRIVETGNEARLITTWGDVHVDRISENDTSENQVLSKSFKAIFNNAGLNDGIFTSESVEGLKISLTRDRAMVWKYIKMILAFYSIAINNWFDFKTLQADIDILPISFYNYNDDMRIYKENATLGVGKLDYIIATGIKQKDIADQLYLEDFLKLDEIKPMQTSYTQTAEDRSEQVDKEDSKESDSKNEPLDKDKEVDENSNVDKDEEDKADEKENN